MHLSTLSPDFDVAIDAGFLQQSFEDQSIHPNFAMARASLCYSYGAYLLLQSLIDQPPLLANVILLSPVLGRAMDSERMLFSRPPREKTLRTAIESGRLGIPPHMEIVTGKDDEVCDWQLAQKFSAAMNISIAVLDGEGHMISPEKVSQAVDSFLMRQ